MAYVDGFVLAVKKSKIDEYKRMASVAGQVWMDHGALSYVECIGDDVPYGKLTSFPRAVLAEEDEVTVFSWVTYESRASRDAVNAKVMADPRMKHEENEHKDVFDGRRMIYGGFEPVIELKK